MRKRKSLKAKSAVNGAFDLNENGTFGECQESHLFSSLAPEGGVWYRKNKYKNSLLYKVPISRWSSTYEASTDRHTHSTAI